MYDTKTEALQDIMNRGFLVFENLIDKTWTIQKISTPLDPSAELPTGLDMLEGLPSQIAALEKVTAWIMAASDIQYNVEAKFDDGLGPKFKTIGTVVADTDAKADILAFEKGQEYFAHKKLTWSVRIKPTQLCNDEIPA